MGDITPFPAPAARHSPPRALAIVATADPSTLPETGGRRGEYALADIARALRLLHLTPKTIITHLRALARHDGLPLPTTPRIVSGRPIHGPDQIWRHSRWDAGIVDAWLNSRGPTPPAAPIAAPIRAEMQRVAIAIGAGR